MITDPLKTSKGLSDHTGNKPYAINHEQDEFLTTLNPSEGKITQISLITGDEIYSFTVELEYLRSDKLDYNSLKVSPDGKFILLGGLYNKVAVVSVDEKRVIQSFKLPKVSRFEAWVKTFEFLDEDTFLALTDNGALYRLSISKTGIESLNLGITGQTNSLRLSPDKSKVFVHGPYAGLIEVSLDKKMSILRAASIDFFSFYTEGDQAPRIANFYASGFNNKGTWFLHAVDSTERHVILFQNSQGYFERLATIIPKDEEYIERIEFSGNEIIITSSLLVKRYTPRSHEEMAQWMEHNGRDYISSDDFPPDVKTYFSRVINIKDI